MIAKVVTEGEQVELLFASRGEWIAADASTIAEAICDALGLEYGSDVSWDREGTWLPDGTYVIVGWQDFVE